MAIFGKSKRPAIFCSVLFLAFFSVGLNAAGILTIGSKGRAVIEIQSYLCRLQYLKRSPDGIFGKLTAEAVKSFQLEHSLPADGKVGPNTMAILQTAVNKKYLVVEHTVVPNETLAGIAEHYNSSIAKIMIKNKLNSNEVIAGQKLLIAVGDNLSQTVTRGRIGGIQVVPWSLVSQLWENGETATIIDVETKKTFKVKRLYGYYHADIEPLTRKDTDMMLSIYGGKWSWARRAVVVRLRNLFIAASINGMPHGQKSIAGNGFPGQFCAHFLGSKVHQGGNVDSDHLAMIEKAARIDLNTLNI